ncbi:MAG TPA: polysaccharide biosynthesis/export family protein [Albitalea sp.]|uniref:polysaccharide biosynthesis/export family protein n=1 Tax=Piscinibacter sp. TaxID=1903157 RepID=UPI002ED04A71
MRLLSTSIIGCVLGALFLAGCAQLPTVGPSTKEVEQGGRAADATIQVVELTDGVARQLLAQHRQRLFSDALGDAPGQYGGIGPGDVLEVNIWEAPPATLFGSGGALIDPRGAMAASRGTALPEQVVDRDGYIVVPFAGKVLARGQTLAAIESEIVKRLTGKANKPEVIVRLTRNSASTVTVVGEVANSTKLPLTPTGERLLDALAAAGGVRQPVNKMTVQITRGSQYFALPLETVIRDPRQNVPLWPGDVVTAMFQPLSFTALGSTGKNEEINFEAQGITLAQALARAGGLVDTRSDPRGVFIFRFEPQGTLPWPQQPAATTPDGLVPVVYRIDLKDPGSFFVMQTFGMNNKDILYVSNAPAAELQKFLNLVFSVAYPVLNVIQVTK